MNKLHLKIIFVSLILFFQLSKIFVFAQTVKVDADILEQINKLKELKDEIEMISGQINIFSAKTRTHHLGYNEESDAYRRLARISTIIEGYLKTKYNMKVDKISSKITDKHGIIPAEIKNNLRYYEININKVIIGISFDMQDQIEIVNNKKKKIKEYEKYLEYINKISRLNVSKTSNDKRTRENAEKNLETITILIKNMDIDHESNSISLENDYKREKTILYEKMLIQYGNIYKKEDLFLSSNYNGFGIVKKYYGISNNTNKYFVLKTFIKKGDFWVDECFENNKESIEIEFGSKKYIDFSENEPEIRKCLETYKNMLLYYKGNNYKIFTK